ncbi:hypothetical protein DPMN_118113 [Dreissena polymorpha]|uniref:Uncharacterized protein n=1 Tax=Dreissena polymorpha TaxID=45954 RepID=A0A9D4GGA4_DREPO|nr:hypothetical protein DPMN_118113 [Dreissena polymorpha]
MLVGSNVELVLSSPLILASAFFYPRAGLMVGSTSDSSCLHQSFSLPPSSVLLGWPDGWFYRWARNFCPLSISLLQSLSSRANLLVGSTVGLVISSNFIIASVFTFLSGRPDSWF